MIPINGEPMIYRQIERIKTAKSVDDLIVATSSDPSDDSLALYLKNKGIEVFRGSLNDVLSRYLEIELKVQPSTIIRLTGDCPLVMPELIDSMVNCFHRSYADYLSNTLNPTYPDGLDVEIMRGSALRKLATLELSAAEREHVTLGMYTRPKQFVLKNFLNDQDLSGKRWTVDYIEDLIFVANIYKNFVGRESKFSFKEVLSVLDNNPSLVSGIPAERRNEKLREKIEGRDGKHDEIR